MASSLEKDMASSSVPGQFVDARGMPSDDAVARTLKETSSPLGIASRPKIVDFTARFRERRRAHVLAAASRVGIVLAVVAAVAALLWVALFSPVFRLEVSGISVSGQNAWVTTSQVMAIASKQAGRSVFLVSSSDVVDQLRNIPGVTGATATKHLPNRLVVTVTAQRPVAMLRTSDGTLTAVDSRGRVLNSVSDTSSSGIPVIDVTDVKSALRRNAIKETLAILSSLPESLRQRVSSVVTKTQDSITTGLDKGKYTIIWGDASDLALKKAVVNTLLSDSTALGSHTEIDVSAPTRPILK
ncbi:FtsQ-type POTRA domain-containing protein [uncultured Bifidobacterium sp.]|uniref:cell division protein FtsQ/DivIB n=1 Tax=uncultured Bifidobacterium sp. TaxID=165187 RepID=UPI0028DCC9A8|nr:FtsQ-type POTRA domain-containing protein [uncultured Bifidobacterium sp.]